MVIENIRFNGVKTVVNLTLFSLFSLITVSPSSVFAALHPEEIHVADSKKHLAYIREGLITGGDRTINDYVLKEIRFAKNSGFERVVIDVEGNRNGEVVAIPRAPYFQVAVQPIKNQLVLTFWGRSKLSFDPKKIETAFRKSALIKKINLFPRLEDNLWTFVVELKENTPIEAFELNETQPVRIILDLKQKRG